MPFSHYLPHSLCSGLRSNLIPSESPLTHVSPHCLEPLTDSKPSPVSLPQDLRLKTATTFYGHDFAVWSGLSWAVLLSCFGHSCGCSQLEACLDWTMALTCLSSVKMAETPESEPSISLWSLQEGSRIPSHDSSKRTSLCSHYAC